VSSKSLLGDAHAVQTNHRDGVVTNAEFSVCDGLNLGRIIYAGSKVIEAAQDIELRHATSGDPAGYG
jgi:hypothetical protein